MSCFSKAGTREDRALSKNSNSCCRIREILFWGKYQVSQTGVSATSVDISRIFAAALKANASGLILAHSHPSGQLYPSDADRSATRRICEAAAPFQINVLDHLTITNRSFTPLRRKAVFRNLAILQKRLPDLLRQPLPFSDLALPSELA